MRKHREPKRSYANQHFILKGAITPFKMKVFPFKVRPLGMVQFLH